MEEIKHTVYTYCIRVSREQGKIIRVQQDTKLHVVSYKLPCYKNAEEKERKKVKVLMFCKEEKNKHNLAMKEEKTLIMSRYFIHVWFQRKY